MEAMIDTEMQRSNYPLAKWLELKSAFVRGEGTLASLCEKLGFNYATVRGKSCKEKWDKKRVAWMNRQDAKLIGQDAPESILERNSAIPDGQLQNPDIEITLKQLDGVNQAILTALFPRDIADLTKAKKELEASLFFHRNGYMPSTKPPQRRKERALVTPIEPQPSQPATEPIAPIESGGEQPNG